MAALLPRVLTSVHRLWCVYRPVLLTLTPSHDSSAAQPFRSGAQVKQRVRRRGSIVVSLASERASETRASKRRFPVPDLYFRECTRRLASSIYLGDADDDSPRRSPYTECLGARTSAGATRPGVEKHCVTCATSPRILFSSPTSLGNCCSPLARRRRGFR